MIQEALNLMISPSKYLVLLNKGKVFSQQEVNYMAVDWKGKHVRLKV